MSFPIDNGDFPYLCKRFPEGITFWIRQTYTTIYKKSHHVKSLTTKDLGTNKNSRGEKPSPKIRPRCSVCFAFSFETFFCIFDTSSSEDVSSGAVRKNPSDLLGSTISEAPRCDVNVGLDSPQEYYSYLRTINHSEIGVINQLSYRTGASHCRND